MGKVIEDIALRNRTFIFRDRAHAGEALAEKLKGYKSTGAWILAIPAGGVPVGFIMSKKLKLHFDIILVRKIHIPWNREAGFGAISWDGVVLFNEPLLQSLDLTEEEINSCIEMEKEDIIKRMRLFRGDKSFLDLRGKTVILVDDGMASGFSILAAIESVKRRDVKEIVVAVPTGSKNAINLVEPHVDKLVCLNIRSGPIFAVADAYKAWRDLREEDIMAILKGN
ncbi:MAG: phosphoribosyltransferase [Methanosarcinales archaeon]|nr:MAG: phosphoribosyltransferase [Methanosarcinales archaeon]